MTKLQAILKKSFSYTLTVIRFSFRYSCKKQELGLDDAYGSLLTWHILWYEKPNSMPSNIFLLLALHNQALSCLRVFIQNYLHKQGLQLVFFYINQDLWLLFSSLKNYKHNLFKERTRVRKCFISHQNQHSTSNLGTFPRQQSIHFTPQTSNTFLSR